MRFDILVASKTERDFYYNAYYYYDYIFTNPQLLELYEKAGKEYRKKHSEIIDKYNNDPRLDGDYCSQMVSKTEKFDAYCNAVPLEVRLYHPMKDYLETDDLDRYQDYLMVALDKGFDYALKVCSPRHGYMKNFKKTFQSNFNNWFVNQRDIYQEQMSRFHMEFIEMVSQSSEPTTLPTAKIRPLLNLETGEFKYFESTGFLPYNGQEFNVLKILVQSDHYKAPYLNLIQSYRPKVQTVTKPEKADLYKIINNLRSRFGILSKAKGNPDIFENDRGIGYKLVFPKDFHIPD